MSQLNIISLSTVSRYSSSTFMLYDTQSIAVAPVILQNPSAVTVLAPNSVNLTCTAEGEPSPDIFWIKETGETRKKYSLSEDGVEIN